MQCLSIEGHEKDEKKCKELNDKVESLIRVLSERQSLGKNCYNKRVKACCEESSQLNEEFKAKKRLFMIMFLVYGRALINITLY